MAESAIEGQLHIVAQALGKTSVQTLAGLFWRQIHPGVGIGQIDLTGQEACGRQPAAVLPAWYGVSRLIGPAGQHQDVAGVRQKAAVIGPAKASQVRCGRVGARRIGQGLSLLIFVGEEGAAAGPGGPYGLAKLHRARSAVGVTQPEP